MAKRAPRKVKSETPAEPRPAPWSGLDSILGQERAIDQLRAAVASRRVHHAWVFHGPQGVGKFTVARAFAAMLLDPASAEGRWEPRLDSDVGQLARAGAHPDLHVITKELARLSDDRSIRERMLTTIPKEVIEEHLIRKVALAPALRGGGLAAKVFIVDEAELLDRSPAAAPVQNAILKTLEEPPERTVIILVTSSVDRLLPTIRSRCQRVAFHPLHPSALAAWLDDRHAELSSEDRAWLDVVAGGSPGQVEQAIATGMVAWRTVLEPLVKDLCAGAAPLDAGAQMAGLVDTWAEGWVKSHEQASKEAANRVAFGAVWRIVGELLRRQLRRDAERGAISDPDHPVAVAIDRLANAQEFVESNVQIGAVLDDWAAQAMVALSR